LQTVERQVEILSSQNKKFQTSINETSAKQENLERELNTQKEIMKQFEITKKEYIQKLKDELENVEERFKKVINQNLMTGEDFRSQAVQNFHKFVNMKLQYKEKTEMLEQSEKELEKAQKDLDELDKYIQDNQMENEDFLSQIVYKTEKIQRHEDSIEENLKKIDILTELKESQSV
jgi:chromosome segregation ATPase